MQWVITTDADESMAKLHNRMPVILARALEAAWLDSELT
jgi:putative SOS response-associated peptidase YedK